MTPHAPDNSVEAIECVVSDVVFANNGQCHALFNADFFALNLVLPREQAEIVAGSEGVRSANVPYNVSERWSTMVLCIERRNKTVAEGAHIS